MCHDQRQDSQVQSTSGAFRASKRPAHPPSVLSRGQILLCPRPTYLSYRNMGG
jgi:hypothetical protein